MADRLTGLLYLLPVLLLAALAFWKGSRTRRSGRAPDDDNAWGGVVAEPGSESGGGHDSSGGAGHH